MSVSGRSRQLPPERVGARLQCMRTNVERYIALFRRKPRTTATPPWRAPLRLGVGAVDFLRGGECRFAFVEARQERSFAQRAEALGLRYTAGPRIEAINVSNGQPITIAVYRSVGRS